MKFGKLTCFGPETNPIENGLDRNIFTITPHVKFYFKIADTRKRFEFFEVSPQKSLSNSISALIWIRSAESTPKQ